MFGANPFRNNGKIPVSTLQLALSAAVRQGPDGRLSQEIGDALDGAALDGASAGSAVLLGTFHVNGIIKVLMVILTCNRHVHGLVAASLLAEGG